MLFNTPHCSWCQARRVVLGLLGQGLHADELESQTVYAVKMGLVFHLPREDRPPAFHLHLHPFEGRSVPLAELTSHYYLVGFPAALVHPASSVCRRTPCSLNVRYCKVA